LYGRCHDHDEAFLQAIIQNPDDDTPRLVYADWLEKHGQPDRAAFIRVQCQLALLPEGDPRRPELEAREQRLLAAHQSQWLEALLRLFDRVPWLEHLGQPTAGDNEVYRLHDWDEWPGPEDPSVQPLYELSQTWYDRLLDEAGPLRKDAEALWERVREAVLSRARPKVPFDPGQDAWHGPTQCVWDVSWWAGLLALHVVFKRRVPGDVGRMWSWVAAGHWPCGYVSPPTDEDGGRLTVY
jgi:uncharacterized protein (TIGR02996 family)